MLSPIKDIFRYIKLFQSYLGLRIYLIFILSLLAAISEGFGILMLFPLLETLDSTQEVSKSEDSLTIFLFGIIKFLGLSQSITGILILITAAFVFKGLVTFFALGFNAYLIGDLLKQLKGSLFDNYSQMSYRYYSSKDTGHFTNLINEQPTKALEAFKQLTIFSGQLINTFVLMSLAFLMTWVFGLMALLVGFLLLILFMSLNSYVRKLSRINAKENGILTRWLIQMLHAFKYLTATNQTVLLRKNILNSISKLTATQVKAGVAAAFTQSVREPIAIVFIMIIVFIQILIMQEKIEPILVSIVLFYRALNATLAVQSGFQGTFQHIGSMEIVDNEFRDQDKNQSPDGDISIEDFSYSIEFNNVSFKYGGSKSKVISGLTMNFPVKKSIAIVGESGAGKSTLADLVTLMHMPTSGEITIDGIPSNQIKKSTWRDQIGYVSQETVIFDDTIANNICMWKESSEKGNDLWEEIKLAAKKANILDFIESLPDGFQSLVGDRGVLLSGGQKQRLFIARELFRKPSLLIMDEATSALDSASEQEIQKSIESLKGQITLILIAHRLSTIKNVDLIHVLDEGRILESGTYKELMEQKDSRFRKLAVLQTL